MTRYFSPWLLALLLAACERGPSPSPSPTPAAKATQPPTAVAAPGAAAPAPDVAASGGIAPSPTAVAGTKYGAGVVDGQPVSIDELAANPKAYEGKKVRVEGLVTDVCPKRGCWFDLAGTAPGRKVKFKVQDGVMVFPMEAKGSYAVAEGVVAVSELTLEETKKHAEYQAKEYGQPIDPAGITEPVTLVRLEGTGAVLRDRK